MLSNLKVSNLLFACGVVHLASVHYATSVLLTQRYLLSLRLFVSCTTYLYYYYYYYYYY